jgi:predicted enzyme related to lactoylglutathione lyase
MTKRPIIHVELPTKDRDAGAKFYAKLFGWTYQHSDQPAPYTLFDTGSIKIGMPDVGEDYQPGNVVFYIHSDDLAADLKRIEKLGGHKLTEPIPVGAFGEMAFFTDPSGNRLALWKGAPGAG